MKQRLSKYPEISVKERVFQKFKKKDTHTLYLKLAVQSRIKQ